MKLKIDNKYVDVDFWSFFKCYFLAMIAMNGIMFVCMILGFIMIALLGIE